jgi:hypothetical protein
MALEVWLIWRLVSIRPIPARGATPGLGALETKQYQFHTEERVCGLYCSSLNFRG